MQTQGCVQQGQRLDHRNLPDRADLRCWQEWELGGRPVGGFRLHAPQWFNFIAFSVWFNNACDATGLYYWGRQTGDDALIDKARRIVNLALAAPDRNGLTPSFYDLHSKSWIPSLWLPPRAGYDPNQTKKYFNQTAQSAYQPAAASVTAGYLMQYRSTCEDDPRIVPHVRRLADFLVKAMDSDGCVPSWFDGWAHRFADPFVRIGLLTGRSDLIERGVAAARSSLTLASLPEQKANGIHPHTDCPPGIGPENIDHNGYPMRAWVTGPSWSTVGDLAGAAHALDRLGGAYVDAARGFGVGVGHRQ